MHCRPNGEGFFSEGRCRKTHTRTSGAQLGGRRRLAPPRPACLSPFSRDDIVTKPPILLDASLSAASLLGKEEEEARKPAGPLTASDDAGNQVRHATIRSLAPALVSYLQLLHTDAVHETSIAHQ